ncbi:putative ricin-type beta-trefoil lectin domain-containing protein [Rosellinia necatrix]|uniref:Putative ricin-type beta-trefoil lectin domain-containing protein n=1 Tax=Rosellinia necatrix TaxID=77044 RepID=A0A1W2TKQ5_ROSNE|nr:putative ricin-type beta-trefoil lectin domain-containing protein [Rosellinia necatrix]
MNFLWLASLAYLAAASPISLPSPPRRAVAQLDPAAFAEAQQPDTTATKAFAGTLIKTADDRCLFVDKLSGDFRANLTPIQVADCGSTDGQEWDIITNGKHNNAPNSMLVVSTLTNACLNFDPRRPAGNQAILFSCGGRADGGGDVTDSQLFPYNGGAGPLSLSPENDQDTCFTVSDNGIDVAPCRAGDLSQLFTFGDALSLQPNPTSTNAGVTSTSTDAGTTATRPATTTLLSTSTTPDQGTTTATTATTVQSTASASSTSSSAVATNTTTATAIGKPNPTSAVPVSGAGGVLQPTAVAESHQRDDGATRAFTSVSIRSPDGRCLFVDPTAGDFRENLIPVSLVACAGTPNERFDVVTAGRHNDAQGAALLVSSLTNGCISFDGRRQPGDTVTIFSCGGRADGGGETNNGQLIPFTGGTRLTLAPESERNATCIVPGNDRLESAQCAGDDSQVFTILT